MMDYKGDSPTSSMDSSSHPSLSTTSSDSRRRDLSTDLQLGISLLTSSSLQETAPSCSRNQQSDWPPIKLFLRSTLTEKANQRRPTTFFVKVYMEGIPIGRKLDLFAHDGYDSLVTELRRMFRTPITYLDVLDQLPPKKSHVLTYEDQEGDWMMVGDVPWELFLTTVKRLRIARADKC